MKEQKFDALELESKIIKNIESRKIEVRLNGHHDDEGLVDGVNFFIKNELWKILIELVPRETNDLKVIENFYEKTIPLIESFSEGIEIPELCLGSVPKRIGCNLCDESLLLYTNGIEIYYKESCKVKHAPFSVDLEINSGKVVVGSDFREFFKIEEDCNLNIFNGRLQFTNLYIKKGLFLSVLSDISPIIRKNKLGLLAGYWGEEDDYDSSEDIAEIETDRYLISFVDYEVLKNQFDRIGLTADFEDFIKSQTVIELEKGTYEGVSHYPYHLGYREGKELFTELKKKK